MTMIDAAKAIIANTAPIDIKFAAINAAARTTAAAAVTKIELLVILATATTIRP